MVVESKDSLQKRPLLAGFTLIEVVVAIGIVALVFGGIISAYIQSTRRAEWTGFSLAAQALAVQQLEQARSARWDTAGSQYNEITNLALINLVWNAGTKTMTGYSWTNLDLPIAGSGSGAGFTRATNFVTITQITNVGGVAQVSLHLVKVDTVWPFIVGTNKRYYTNTIATLLAPDDRATDTF